MLGLLSLILDLITQKLKYSGYKLKYKTKQV